MPSSDQIYYAVEHKDIPGDYLTTYFLWNGSFCGALIFHSKTFLNKMIESRNLNGKVVKVTVHARD